MPRHHHPQHPHSPPHSHRRGRFSDLVVGVLGRLYDRASDYETVETLKAHLANREPGETRFLEAALAEFAATGTEVTQKRLLRVMCNLKALEYFQRDKDAALHGLNGNGNDSTGEGEHALILPVPPHHLFDLLDDITTGKLYVLPGHYVHHELDDWNVAELPTRSRTIKAELISLLSMTFEGFMDRNQKIATRREITDLLADLADIGVKPLLRVVLMPHRPHHEDFEVVEDGYQIETLE